MRVVHVTPTYFSDTSVVGGGERYVHNACKSLSLQSAISQSDILSFGAEAHDMELHAKSMLRIAKAGSPKSFAEADAYSLSRIQDYLADYDVVHVHQCLTPFGLFVASHGRLLGKKVIGTDHGGGETPLYQSHPFLYKNFDVLHAQSKFATSSFADAPVPVKVIKGPVDDRAFKLFSGKNRDRGQLVSIGRILPHKGFEDLIDALPAAAKLTIIGRIGNEGYYSFLRSRIGGKQVVFEASLDDKALLARIQTVGLYLHGSVSTGFNGDLYLKSELLGLAPLECMLTGMPAISNQTAALQELGSLKGCKTYQTKEELGDLLRAHLDGSLVFPTGEVIREDVVENYGLDQFGKKYVAAIEEIQPCAC